MAILVVVPNSMWVLAILWLDLIDYSTQCGSFDVGVSLPAACSAASSVVPAPVVAAFPFPSCGLALSAELRLYPVFCFQSWNVD